MAGAIPAICVDGPADAPRRDRPAAPGRNKSNHPKRVHVGLKHRLVLHPLVLILLAQPHDRAQRLDVIAIALGLGIDVADVVSDRLLLLLEPLDALDDGLELILGETRRGLLGLDGGSGGGSHGYSSQRMVPMVSWHSGA